jgi:hypothetical protein
MTTDLHDEVRHTLASQAQAVDVPPIDHLAFQDHVRAARRGVRVRRSAWLAAGSGVVAAGVVGAIALSGVIAPPDSPRAAYGPATYAAATSSTPPVILAGRGTVIQVADQTSDTANVPVSLLQDVYRTDDGLLVVDEQSSPLRIRVEDGSGGEPLEVGEPKRLAHAVDNLAVAADGKTGAWFALVGGEVEFVMYDFAQGEEIFTKPIASDGAVGTIVAVSGAEAIVSVGPNLELWNSDNETPLGFDLSPYAFDASSNAGIVAFSRADMTGTDLFADNGRELQKLATVPVVSGEVSPEGDNVVGFTPYAVDGPHSDDQNPDYLELWSTLGDSRSSFTGLPQTVYEFVWLDNDTIALTGGPSVGRWPGELDTYTCELSDLTCTKVADDETGPDDRLPMLAGGRGM